MLTNANFSDRNLTDFDFHDLATRERLYLWLDVVTAKIARSDNLRKPESEKLVELLKIIHKDGKYKIPYKKGERKPLMLKRDEQLVCWYRITLETQLEMRATDSKKATAERFGISQKLVEAHCTRHRKGIDRMIEKFGYDEVSLPYIEHLLRYKKGTEKLLTGFLAKYTI